MQSLLVLAVLVYSSPATKGGPKLSEVADALKEALRAGGAEVVDGAVDKARAEHARGWVSEAALGFFAEARAAVDEGRRALERVELEKAEAAFARAEQLYANELARPGVAPLSSGAALQRGVALFELGRATEARRAFQRAVALDGAAQLTEAMVRPDVARAFAEAIAPRGRKLARLLVPGERSLTVAVDGKSVGAAPASVEVSEGGHLVVVTAEGQLPSAQIVEVAAGETSVHLSPRADPVLAALASLRARPDASGVRSLSEALGLDGVVAAAVGVDAGVPTVVGQRFSARGCASALVTLAKPDLARAAATLATRLPAPPETCAGGAEEGVLEAPAIARPRAAPIVVATQPLKPHKPKFYERPWLWVGLLAVTSVAVGLGAGLAPHDTTYRTQLVGANFTK